jgi:hypothetical protein
MELLIAGIGVALAVWMILGARKRSRRGPSADEPRED